MPFFIFPLFPSCIHLYCSPFTSVLPFNPFAFHTIAFLLPPPLSVLCLAMRADINECERVPMPCAYQCVNSPGSYRCTCPPGRHLLGDGKSCAGLERLPRFESLSYGFHTSQTSPERRSSQHLYHSLTSQSYHSYAVTGGNYRLSDHASRSRRATKMCPLGFISAGAKCIGKDFSSSVLKLPCRRTLNPKQFSAGFHLPKLRPEKKP